MVCSNCGYALGPDDQYCGGCGAFLTDAPEDEHETWPEEAAAAGAAPGPGGPGTGSGDTPWGIPYVSDPTPAPQPSRAGLSTGMVAAGVAAVVLLALLLIWVLGRDGGDPADRRLGQRKAERERRHDCRAEQWRRETPHQEIQQQ